VGIDQIICDRWGTLWVQGGGGIMVGEGIGGKKIKGNGGI